LCKDTTFFGLISIFEEKKANAADFGPVRGFCRIFMFLSQQSQDKKCQKFGKCLDTIVSLQLKFEKSNKSMN